MVIETKVGLTSHLETAQDYSAPVELQVALRDEKVVPFFWKSGGMYTEKSVGLATVLLTRSSLHGTRELLLGVVRFAAKIPE